MKTRFPSADEYTTQEARYPDSTVVDIQACQRTINEPYRNDVLSNVNGECLRLAVFEGEYRWHCHPDSDELFLVAAGKLQIDLAGNRTVELGEWQYAVVPAGTAHRTRAIGRTVNITFEKQHAGTVFIEPAAGGLPASNPQPPGIGTRRENP
ncbi:MAG: cupin domain-containing protein [Xanthomonadales bacterium]|nr:cupin domain-containing protein [Xanthomonadales bacterium]